MAGITLRKWQAMFNRIGEPGARRLLLGHNGRLIHADPWIRSQLFQHPQMLDELLASLYPVASQRWEIIDDRKMRDFTVSLCGRPYWISFRCGQSVDLPNSEYWYLELREIEPDDLPPVGYVSDGRIARSLAYIHERYQQSPSLPQIAKAVEVSQFHFHRLFVKHVGISPKHYVQRLQMQTAKWMLRCDRTSIGYIAKHAGFSSHGHFTTTFQRMVGVSPSQYRDSH